MLTVCFFFCAASAACALAAVLHIHERRRITGIFWLVLTVGMLAAAYITLFVLRSRSGL